MLVRAEKDMAEFLKESGIVVRRIENVLGLDGVHLRITVGRENENDALLDTLRSYGRKSTA